MEGPPLSLFAFGFFWFWWEGNETLYGCRFWMVFWGFGAGKGMKISDEMDDELVFLVGF